MERKVDQRENKIKNENIFFDGAKVICDWTSTTQQQSANI